MTRAVAVTWVVSCLAAPAAFAASKQACNDAYEQSQTLRDQHQLVRAREQLRICAATGCPGAIVKECSGWLKDVEARIPSVVLTAKDASGSDVTEANVTMDGAPLTNKLDGIPIDVDPGAHTFVFDMGGQRIEQKVVVPEGGKDQRIAVVYGGGGMPGALAVEGGAPVAGGPPGATSTASTMFSEPVPHGLSLGLRLGYGIAFGNIDSATPITDYASGQVPIWLDVGYLLSPYFYVGAYLSYGFVSLAGNLSTACSATGIGCSAGDLRVGVDVQWRVLGPDRLQPWVGLGFLGYEDGNVNASSLSGATQGESYSGVEWVSPQAGFDYKVLPTLSAGVFVATALAQYLGDSTSANGLPTSAPPLTAHALHGWVFIGARANFDLRL